MYHLKPLGRTCRDLRALASFAALALLLITGPLRAESTVDGYRYTLHSAKPPASAFDDDPDTFRSSEKYVAQGPVYTLIWTSKDGQTLDRAGFARGERRMGLFVPFWDPARSASNESGWSSFGRPVAYRTFQVKVERGDQDRMIAGQTASHHVVSVDLTTRLGNNDAYRNIRLTSNVWVHEDKPYSSAPFATAGIYGDPRLQAAFNEQLGDLGMVVRAETVHSSQAQDEEGSELGHARDGTHLTWVSNLESARVDEVRIPMASEKLMDDLRDASRTDPEGTCQAVMGGTTPEFASELLDDDQQPAFMEHLAAMCERRASAGQG